MARFICLHRDCPDCHGYAIRVMILQAVVCQFEQSNIGRGALVLAHCGLGPQAEETKTEMVHLSCGCALRIIQVEFSRETCWGRVEKREETRGKT